MLASSAPEVDSRWDAQAKHLDVEEPGWWSFIDWFDFTAEALQTAMDAQYAVALAAAIRLARRAGDDGTAIIHQRRLDAVLRVLGRVEHPHAATILLCGLPATIARRHVGPEVLTGFCPETGYFAFSVARAYLALGDPESAAALVETYWGGMLDAGATTWWERWSPEREVTKSTQASLCHPWSAGPVVLLPMLALGVDPFAVDPGDARFPALSLDDDVSTLLHTPWGITRSPS